MIRLMDKLLHDLIDLNYGVYGTILYLGHAEFCPSTVRIRVECFWLRSKTMSLLGRPVLPAGHQPRVHGVYCRALALQPQALSAKRGGVTSNILPFDSGPKI